MNKLTKVDKSDWKFVPVNPDPGFSPEHNNEVILRTIEKGKQVRAEKKRVYEEGLGEKVQAAATFIKSVSEGRTSSDIETYFGRKELARLRGKELIERLRDGLRVVGTDGKILRTNNGQKS